MGRRGRDGEEMGGEGRKGRREGREGEVRAVEEEKKRRESMINEDIGNVNPIKDD